MDFNEIIKKFRSDSEYIKDPSEVIEYLKSKKTPLEVINQALFEVLEWNNLCYRKKKKEIMANTGNDTQKSDNSKTSEKTDEKVDYEHSLDTNYMSVINACDDLDFLTDMLPSKYDVNYEDIIKSILIELYQNLCCANDGLKKHTDNDSQVYLQTEFDKIRQIIKIIKEYNLEEMEDDLVSSDSKKKALMYLTSSSGTVYAESDISEINEEDYPFTLSLIEELSEGRIKREKRFKNFEDLKGISALRKKDSRIIFTRLNNDTFLILGILTKRFQNSGAYRDFLKRRAKKFRDNKDAYKVNLDDQEILRKSDEVTVGIKEKLNGQRIRR